MPCHAVTGMVITVPHGTTWHSTVNVNTNMLLNCAEHTQLCKSFPQQNMFTLNVNSSAHNCGCVVDGGNTMSAI